MPSLVVWFSTEQTMVQQVTGLDRQVQVVARTATLAAVRRSQAASAAGFTLTVKLSRCCSTLSGHGQLVTS